VWVWRRAWVWGRVWVEKGVQDRGDFSRRCVECVGVEKGAAVEKGVAVGKGVGVEKGVAVFKKLRFFVVFPPSRCFLPTFFFFPRLICERFGNSKNDVNRSNTEVDFLQRSCTHHHPPSGRRC
jgi:hypothetical protein